MEFQLFDRVKVKQDAKELFLFTNAKSGWITGYNITADTTVDMFEVEFATGSISARIFIPSSVLEKVTE